MFSNKIAVWTFNVGRLSFYLIKLLLTLIGSTKTAYPLWMLAMWKNCYIIELLRDRWDSLIGFCNNHPQLSNFSANIINTAAYASAYLWPAIPHQYYLIDTACLTVEEDMSDGEINYLGAMINEDYNGANGTCTRVLTVHADFDAMLEHQYGKGRYNNYLLHVRNLVTVSLLYNLEFQQFALTVHP